MVPASISQTSSQVYPDNSASTFTPASTGQLQQRLASLVQQLAALQQQNSTQQQRSSLLHSNMVPGLQPTYPSGSMQDCAEPLGCLARTTTNAGAVLRTLSTRNPRVLALAAAAAKAPHGTPEHAAVLSALKDEIMQASGNNADATARAGSAAATAHADLPAAQSPAMQEPTPAEEGTQQQPLTQDALWAALMAKAAARSGANGSNPSSPHKQPPKQQHSPKPLPGHGSSDSAMEVEGTSCSLPWALLQAAQQAQQEEEEKEAAAAAAAEAAAAAAAASAAEAAAAEAAAAAACAPSAMAVDPAPERAAESPKRTKSSGSGLTRGNSTVVFKRRNLNNSNALQKHFSKPTPQPQHAPQPLARTQSEVPTVPKLQYTFKKQTKRRPLVMRGGSSSNLAALQQLSKQQQQQLQSATNSPGAGAAEPEYSAETGATGAGGSYVTQAAQDNGPTLSNVSMRAPAVTAPAAVGAPGVTDVLSFLASREKQLHFLQEQLSMQRRRMTPSAGTPRESMSGLSGGAVGFSGTPTATAAPNSPTFSNSTAAAISELQRLLGSMAAAAGPNSAAAAAAAAAGVPVMQPAAEQPDVDMTDYAAARMDAAAAAAAAAVLAQAKLKLSQQQQQQQQQQSQQYQALQQYQQEEASMAHVNASSAQTLSTIKALAAALVAKQQQQQQQHIQAPAGFAGGMPTSDLLRKLAAALHGMD